MSIDDQFRAPAGWYPDPLGHPQLRWWNAQGWTEQVSAVPQPVIVQEARFAWKDDEPPVVVQAATPVQTPVPPRAQVAPTLNQLEAPRAASQVSEPAAGYTKYAPEGWTAPASVPEAAAVMPNLPPAAHVAPPAPAAVAPAAAAPAAPAAPAFAAPVAQTPPPPPYWDEDDATTPAPSIDPADLKFWSASPPAEVRRRLREQAARDAANGQ